MNKIFKILEHVGSAIQKGLEERNSGKDKEDTQDKEAEAVVEETQVEEAVTEEALVEETVVEEPKNCGCGKTPCETYGDVDENKKAALAKKLAKASASTQKGKDKVTLKKAPWDKKEDVSLTELKKGDTVMPNKGPHAGQPHEIIHDFGDGHYNIKPKGLTGRQIKYRMGAVKAKAADLKLRKEEIDEAKISMKNSVMKYYYVDPNGVVQGVGSKDAMRKMNVKQAKDGNKGGHFSQNFKKYKVGDKIKEEVELDEASKEGTIRIIDLGNRRPDKIRKELGVDGLPNKGFQVQRMTKGKFVNQGKPYKSQKDAEKVRKSGQHSMQFEAKMSQDQINKLKKGYELSLIHI